MSEAVNYHRWIVEEFEPYLGRNVAEIGAGIGSVSSLLLQRDIDALTAFEPSVNMFPYLAELLEANPRARAVNDFLAPNYAGAGFDSVLYLNVLEHIEDDELEVANAYSCLKPGGHLLVFVPALAWLYSDVDREVGHFRRYTRNGLLGLVKNAGLTPVISRYFDIAGILPWLVNFRLLRNPITEGGVRVYDRLVVPVMRVVEGVLAPPLGKNVLLVARKD